MRAGVEIKGKRIGHGGSGIASWGGGSALLRLPAQAEPGQVAQLDGPGDGVSRNKILVVEKRHESIVFGDGHVAHPVEWGLGLRVSTRLMFREGFDQVVRCLVGCVSLRKSFGSYKD